MKTRIVVDWGSSHFRACLLCDKGRVLAQTSSRQGALVLDGSSFESYLSETCKDWLEPGVEVFICGMAGSRNGWLETLYLECPIEAQSLADGLVSVPNSLGVDIYLVPGISCFAENKIADVMRGEETQIVGYLAQQGQDSKSDAIICLPGTHSKWVRVKDGVIGDFSTYLTGEMFDLLGRCGSLSNLCQTEQFEQSDFLSGIAASLSHDNLLNQLFTVRARVMTGLARREQSKAYLSGLLIGTEFQDALLRFPTEHLILVGSPLLLEQYQQAARAFNIQSTALNGMEMTINGLKRLSHLSSSLSRSFIT